jgi:hypothetical protein
VKIKGLKDEAIVYVENVKPIEDRYPPPFLEKGDEVLFIGTRYHGEKGVFVEEAGLLGERRYAVQLPKRELTSLFERDEILPLKLFDERIESIVKDALDVAFAKKAISDTVAPPSAPLGPSPIPKDQLHYYEDTVYIGLASGNKAPHILVEVSDGVFEFHSFHDVFGTRDNGSVSRSHWISPIRGGLECLRQHAGIGFEIYGFSSTREAFTFFLEHLPKEKKA